jgi:putative sporulation protein YyaC
MFDRLFSKDKRLPLEVHFKNSFAINKISDFLTDYLTSDSAIVCIGTDKCIVDSLGPLVGTFLSKQDIGIDVYGTLSSPVHAKNMDDYIEMISKKNYSNVIAIDACLSNKKGQGIIEVREGPITPGKGVGKVLPEIGDYSIIGIVDTSNKEFHELVQGTRLSLIYEMAEIISSGVVSAVNNKKLYKEVANCL